MKKIYIVFLFALTGICSSPCKAADSDLQEWSVFTFQGPKNERLKGYFEAPIREQHQQNVHDYGQARSAVLPERKF